MKGLGASPGVGYAKVFVIEEKPIVIPEETNGIVEENNLFEKALTEVYEETLTLKEKVLLKAGEAAAEIFDAHCCMIMDEGLTVRVRQEISQGMGAAKAVEKILSEFIKIFQEMDNEYISARALDIKDIKERLIRKILNIEVKNVCNFTEPVILVGYDISPSTIAALDLKNVEGLVMEFGRSTSHTSILARTLEIPAVVGVKGLMKNIDTGNWIAIFGNTGEIFIEISKEELQEILEKSDQ